jgi:hypothetical protein
LHRGVPLVAVALAALAPAGARGRVPVTVAGHPGTCPAPAAVGAALGASVRAASVTLAPPDSATASARVEDLGPRYRVRVGGSERVIEDPGRDCGERARVAAIFVALTLFPPPGGAALVAPPATPSATQPTTVRASQATSHPVSRSGTVDAPAPPVAAPAETAPPRTAWRGEVALAPLALFTPGGAGSAATVAGEVRVRAGTRRLGLTLGAQADGDLTLPLTGGSTARLSRNAYDLGAFAAWTTGQVGLVADLGVALATLTARGQGVGTDATSAGLAVGLRGAAGARYWLTQWVGIAVDVALVAVPQRIDLVATPVRESLGTAQHVWLGLGLGLVARTD